MNHSYDNRVITAGNPGVLVDCLKSRNHDLVYVRTLKCASEFFYRNFSETAGWQPIDWNAIDWVRCQVFSYIMDPVIRRHKGIAEMLLMHNLGEEFLRNSALQDLVQHLPVVEEHSESLTSLYGARRRYIDWIPLTPLNVKYDDHQRSYVDENPAADLTDRLLTSVGHLPVDWNQEFLHVGHPLLNKVYQRVRELWDSTPHLQTTAARYLKSDVGLYNEVLNRFNPQGLTWKETSWLVDR